MQLKIEEVFKKADDKGLLEKEDYRLYLSLKSSMLFQLVLGSVTLIVALASIVVATAALSQIINEVTLIGYIISYILIFVLIGSLAWKTIKEFGKLPLEFQQYFDWKETKKNE